jgi:hypothetical protein
MAALGTFRHPKKNLSRLQVGGAGYPNAVQMLHLTFLAREALLPQLFEQTLLTRRYAPLVSGTSVSHDGGVQNWSAVSKSHR